jgi:hypothetical protein
VVILSSRDVTNTLRGCLPRTNCNVNPINKTTINSTDCTSRPRRVVQKMKHFIRRSEAWQQLTILGRQLSPSLAKPRVNSRKLSLQSLDNPLGTNSPARRCLSTTVREKWAEISKQVSYTQCSGGGYWLPDEEGIFLVHLSTGALCIRKIGFVHDKHSWNMVCFWMHWNVYRKKHIILLTRNPLKCSKRRGGS